MHQCNVKSVSSQSSRKMKAVFVFLAILSVGFAAPSQTKGLVQPKSLNDDLLDFLALLPLDEILAISNDHLENDGAVATVIVYLQGPEWAELVDEVASKPEVQDFIQYLEDAGLPVDVIIALIHEIIANAVPGAEPEEDGSIRSYLDDIEAVIPTQDLIDLLNDKMQNSPDFQAFYTRISSDDARALVEEVRAIPEVQRLAQRLRDLGVNVDETLAIIYEFLGWGTPKVQRSVKSLIDDLLDFVALLPLTDILEIVDDHLQNDGAFAAVILYLQGPEWAELVDEVISKPEVQDFIQYLEDAGLPVDIIIELIHELIAGAVPGVDPEEDGSLRPLLDEIEAVIPIEDLIALLNDKMQNSPDFQAFYTRISSDDARALVEEVRAIPEVQRLAQRLRDLGVNVDETLAIIYEFLGWGTPKKFVRF